ncbi:MAG: zinc ribbon domain-containing protein [Chitinivibrionales bacterium]|nr:zinc ribbon domain-containing protein [Chitinivibrionales bacterium]MBD3358975.1 zinc ribbon domain-containing protein [Chitinivibrionales bacterium]
MPLYEYRCAQCNQEFEELVSAKDKQSPSCPFCSSTRTEKKISLFGGISGGSGESCGNSGFT